MAIDNKAEFIRLVDILYRERIVRYNTDIARALGIDKSNITQIVSGDRNVSANMVDRLYDAFPQLHDYKVVTPDPTEIVHNRKLIRPNTELIPYYEEDFFAGTAKEIDTPNSAPAYYMDINVFRGCIAFRAYGDSMAKLIQSGTILFAKKIEEWKVHLEFGQIYGVVMKDGRKYLKYIQPVAANKKLFLLESHNKHYAPFEVPKDKIHNIWLVEGWLNKTA